MSGPFGAGSLQYFSGGAAEFYNFPIEQSLRFNDDDSAYLSWTPDSAGNRKTWTWSGWVKRGNLGTSQPIITQNPSGSNTEYFQFNNADKLEILEYDGAFGYLFTTTQVFRDPSAWYHILVVMDTTQATTSERFKMYINGQQVTVWDDDDYPSQNAEFNFNTAAEHRIGHDARNSNYLDGYLAEVNFIDGTALDADSFGELKNGVWIPKDPSGLTYGTNGFRLSFADDAEVEAFNTVLYRGNATDGNRVTGVGFKPDLIWTKTRDSANEHFVMDSVRGTGVGFEITSTYGDITGSQFNASFDPDGFTVNSGARVNRNGEGFVAWCWKAGDSNVSNTDGSITSTVRANTDYGFSIVSYSGNQTLNDTVGHGLGATPDLIIIKQRNTSGNNWIVQTSMTGTSLLYLNTTDAAFTNSGAFNNTLPNSSTINLGTWDISNGSGSTYIAYCWAEKAGYSKFGSYTGTGASGNEVTLGFKPAVVIIKRTDSTSDWAIVDNTRDVDPDGDGAMLKLNANYAEANNTTWTQVDLLSNSFRVDSTDSDHNASGGTYIYAAFADTREAAFWLDQSGNDNDWQPVNLDHNDTVADSPTDNFATLNPLDKHSSMTLSEGNLVVSTTISSAVRATIGVESGKWYWEVTCLDTGNPIGLATAESTLSNYPGSDAYAWTYNTSGEKYNDGTATAYGSAYGVGDTVGVAFDADAGTLVFYKNGVSQGTAFTGLTSGPYFPVVGRDSWRLNFGQLGFTYTPPTDYLALSTANLPDPVIDPAQGSSPEDYFNTVLYTGDGTSSRAVTGVGFAPDFVWHKTRNVAQGHNLLDTVRGANKRLGSDDTNAEFVDTNFLNSFDSDGFTIGDDGHVNDSGETYVAWNWKANGSGVSNTDGSITSTVSANTTSGFSIVDWEGTGANATVGHGLDSAPEMVIVKHRNSVIGHDWSCYHSAIGNTALIKLNTTGTPVTTILAWNNTSPTTSVFSLGSGGAVNESGTDFIAYCFHSVEGFSKFGSYTGNGSADGPFVYTGFRPSFLLIKRTDGGTNNWVIYDKERDPYNYVDSRLFPNTSGSESGGGASYSYDFLSNGFKVRSIGSEHNISGGTYIYMAFAENPFKYSNAR